MKLTGFADEAAPDLATQIKATQELGWQYISARGIDGKNMHDLSDSEFDTARGQLEDAGIRIAEFGSLIGSWSKNIKSDFALTLDEVDRAIPRMQQTRHATSSASCPTPSSHGVRDQHEQERFRRLREITKRFSDAGLITAHENCMNWGGFSSAHTLRLIEEVPGLKLIFDTGNPVFQRDRSIPEPQRTTAGIASSTAAEGSQGKPTPPWQDAWQFYQAVREHIIHIHIKDCRNPVNDEPGAGIRLPRRWPGLHPRHHR